MSDSTILDAMCLLEKKYLKIIKVLIKDDTFRDIKLGDSEIIMGEHFTDWYLQFADYGVHPDDIERYKNFIENFNDGDVLYYRRLDKSEWDWVCLEVLEAQHSTSTNPMYYFFIRKCDNEYIQYLADNRVFVRATEVIDDRREYNKFCANYDGSHVFVLYASSEDADSIVSMIRDTYESARVFHISKEEFVVISDHSYEVLSNEIATIKKMLKHYDIKFYVGAGECGNGVSIYRAIDKARNMMINSIV